MSLLNPESAEERLKSTDNLARLFGKKEPNPNKVAILPNPRAGKRPELPEQDKVMIKVLAATGDKQKTIAAQFGTSQGEVSAIKRGIVPVEDQGLSKEVREEAYEKATDLLMRSLGFITDDKLADTSATKLSAIAANMGRVVEKITPRSDQSQNVQVVIYCPEQRSIEDYKVIEV